MSNMTSANYSLSNALVNSLFRHQAFHTAVLWILGIGLLLIALSALRGGLSKFNLSTTGLNEPRARSILRIGFALIWLVDGILQFQADMPLGLANDVVRPMAQGTPGPLHSLMLHAILLWNIHPISLAVGAAWIQVGIALLLLVSNSAVGRLAALVSVGWAFLIWLVGNGAGGIFQNTSSILFGWPGATLFYVFAGIALALRNEQFERHFVKWTNWALALILVGGAVLQMLPDRGFWQGGNANAETSMASTMTQTAQPHLVSWLMNRMGEFAGTLGGGFNIIVILWLLVTAFGLWRGVSARWNWPSYSLAVGALIFWVVSEDAPFWGGLATDVNSLLPLAVLAFAARPSLTGAPALSRKMPKEMRSSTGLVVACFSAAMILFSVVSMGVASFSGAESTLFQAQNGPATIVNTKSPGFSLVDQNAQRYTLGQDHRFVLLTVLDPHCWTDCPLLAAQIEQIRKDFPASAPLDIVALAADPYHEQISDLRTFMKEHGLYAVKNFHFVTGPLSTMQATWNEYGIGVTMKRTDKMSIHSDFMFVINPSGRLRAIVPDDPTQYQSGQESAEATIHGLMVKLGLK